MRTNTKGFSLIECLVMLVVVGMLVMIAVPMLGAARMQMRAQSSAEKLMTIGQAGSMYAQDNADRLFSYTWRAGEVYTLPTGRKKIYSDDTGAADGQNQEILMRNTGRVNGLYKIQSNAFRLPHRRFTHLVLMDYMNQPFGSDLFIDPSDGKQQYWKDNPLEYGSGSNVPYADGIPAGYDTDQNWAINSVRQRWAFGSSYIGCLVIRGGRVRSTRCPRGAKKSTATIQGQRMVRTRKS